MSKIKNREIQQNDVLCGLLGRACHCTNHTPLDHFNIDPGDPNQESEIELRINDIEVPGAAGLLQAYFRQYEKLIAQRVRSTLEGDLKDLRSAVFWLTTVIKDIEDNFKVKYGNLLDNKKTF